MNSLRWDLILKIYFYLPRECFNATLCSNTVSRGFWKIFSIVTVNGKIFLICVNLPLIYKINIFLFQFIKAKHKYIFFSPSSAFCFNFPDPVSWTLMSWVKFNWTFVTSSKLYYNHYQLSCTKYTAHRRHEFSMKW